MKKHKLGTIAASEQLIKDLYINLRNEVNAWSEVTCQTPQARMGYIGQHLVSVVTGFPGGKSGARGYDIVIDEQHFGEIKTCYRVDQLGKCSVCKNVVSSLEKECSLCGSDKILRKDDSKWLISIRHDEDFAKMLDPYRYYFVLFEFEEIVNPKNNNIVASIWEVDPKVKGFAYCMIDYYINIRENSKSKAPFDMWPYSFKFALTQPTLIYRAVIKEDGSITTNIFPTLHNSIIEELKPLEEYSRAKTITIDVAKEVLKKNAPNLGTIPKTKKKILEMIEIERQKSNISNQSLCDIFSDAVYLPLILPKKALLPTSLTGNYPDLQ